MLVLHAVKYLLLESMLDGLLITETNGKQNMSCENNGQDMEWNNQDGVSRDTRLSPDTSLSQNDVVERWLEWCVDL